jgi:transcriptional regulator with XRE-family HTH domain
MTARRRAPRPKSTRKRTKLAAARLNRRLTQEELADLVGLSRATYQRLEHGQMENPPLRYLVNCAIVLGYPLARLVDDGWTKWLPLDENGAVERPPPAVLRRIHSRQKP